MLIVYGGQLDFIKKLYRDILKTKYFFLNNMQFKIIRQDLSLEIHRENVLANKNMKVVRCSSVDSFKS